MRRTETKPVQQKIRVVSFATLLSFLVLVIIGISLGEPEKVLEQAVQICLSCIGIG